MSVAAFIFRETTYETFHHQHSLCCHGFERTASFAQSSLPSESSKAVPDSTASDTVDVQHVIDAYYEAVLNHDGSRLAHLFIPRGSMWLNVFSDEAYARAKAKIAGMR